MKYKVLNKNYQYDGSQLRTGWISEVAGIEGDVIVAFLGSCDVQPEHMLDTEDLEQGQAIRAQLMLHFIVEHPGIILDLAVARQRLLACLAQEVLKTEYEVKDLSRDGDDLYIGGPSQGRKLSISVASTSATSGLIHFAVNVDPADAPVPAIGLEALAVVPMDFAESLLKAYVTEIESCHQAARKVRPAR